MHRASDPSTSGASPRMNDQLEVRPAPQRTASPPPRRRRRWVAPLLLLVLLGVGGLLAWRLLGAGPGPQAGRQAARAGGAPQSVGVATIATGNLDVVLTGLGAVTPLDTVTVQTQINGQLQSLGFTEGQIVHKGQFLAQIDPRPYQVALEQAQGTLAHDTGLLEEARVDLARYQLLARQNSIALQQAADQAFLVKQYEGSVMTDQGAIDSAKLNLAYCHITSPVDGRVGIRLVDPGNYVQASSTTGLFVLVQLQPISVIFTLPEDDVDALQAQMAQGTLAVTAYDRANAEQLAAGTLATIDDQIDATTGTVKLRAMFPNTDNALFPQQFVNAHLLLQTLRGVVVAPAAAIQQGAPGAFVYLVKPDDTVTVTPVKTGVTQGDMVQVTDGLHPGDRVVTDGLDRLRDGARITVAAPPGTAPAAAGAPGAGRRRRAGASGAPAAPASDGAATAPAAPSSETPPGAPAAP